MIGMSVTYDGKNLTELFNEGQGRTVPVDVTKNVASNFNNNYQDQGRRRYGQQFLYSTLSVLYSYLNLESTKTISNAATFLDCCTVT